MTNTTLSSRLVRKLAISFFLIVMIMGTLYVLISIYFTNKYFQETSQRLNAHLANHLIEEKFANGETSPLLESGELNKPLFGDLMHDMMAVNRGIEVYLIDKTGRILYSVVLDHNSPDAKVQTIDLAPVKDFIECNGDAYILGDDPRNPGDKKVFSAGELRTENFDGYIYIVLAGQAAQEVYSSLFTSYFLKIGLGASILTMIFAAAIGILSIWFLTKNLRKIIATVRRFRDGDSEIRIDNPQKSDLSVLAQTFNEMADTLTANIKEIESVDKLRRELIANVSHDLRTPLSVLRGYVETYELKLEDLSEDQKKDYLETIKKSADKLAKLIDQLFEYSKLEADQIQPHKEPFQMVDLAHDLIANYNVLAKSKKISIALEVPKESVPLVFGDISLVERAIQNLMDNALKFTPENGDIRLAIEASEKDVMINITDSGPGIPVLEQAQIFERYRQAPNVKKGEGIGLGLAIVKKIMELHNTTVQVISPPDKGCTFQFLLPVYSA